MYRAYRPIWLSQRSQGLVGKRDLPLSSGVNMAPQPLSQTLFPRCKCGQCARRARRGGGRGGAGGHAGRAGGRESAAHAARSHPKCCPISRSEVDSLCTRTGPAAAERRGAPVLVVNLSAGRTCLWSAIDGSRTPARDRRHDGLGTFACAAALDRNATSATPARARRRRRIQPSAAAATAFDGARTSPPEQPA